MTDFGNLLTQMSSAFNQPREKNEEVEIKLTEDKTLKWRGLHNNQFAAAKRKSKPSKNDEENGSHSAENEEELRDQEVEEEAGVDEILCENSDKNQNVSVNEVDITSESVDKSKCEEKNSEEIEFTIETEDKNESEAKVVKHDDVVVTSSEDKNEVMDNKKVVDEKEAPESSSEMKIEAEKKLTKRTKKQVDKSERVLRRNRISTPLPAGNNSIVEEAQDKKEAGNLKDKVSVKKTFIKNDSDSSPKIKKQKIDDEIAVAADPKESGEKKKGRPKKDVPIEDEVAITLSKGDAKVVLSGEDEIKPDNVDKLNLDESTKVDERAQRTEIKIDAVELDDGEEVKPDKDSEMDIKTEDPESPTSPKSLKAEDHDGIDLSKMPKKRGRKPKTKEEEISSKTSSPLKKSQRVSKEGSVLATAMARKEKSFEQMVPQQRLSRRIKPTAKILANDELRYGFVLHNNARLSMGTEVQDSSEELDLKNDKKTPSPPPIDSSTTSQPTLITSDLLIPPKEKTPVKEQILEAIHTPTPPLRKSCPDPEVFLQDIKTLKIGINRSPEDKKLNKKQQRRLLKLKEKHFALLGLRKTSKIINEQDSDVSSNESSDNEEFVPKSKIQVQSKTGVTLRHRTPKQETPPPPPVLKLPASPIRKRKSNFHPIIPITSTKTQTKSSSTPSITSPSKPTTAQTLTTNITSITPSTLIGDASSTHPTTNTPKAIRNPILSPSQQSKLITNNKQIITKETTTSSSISASSSESQSTALTQFLCLCDKKSQYYVRKSQSLTQCVAVDQIEHHHVGCTNEVQGELLNLMRPSSRVSYMILCETHRKRLMAHNCCAGCGVFCSQGKFAACSRNHLFHRDCANKIIVSSKFDPNAPRSNLGPMLAFQCPHCGLDAYKDDFRITVKCRDTFVMLPHHLKRAKMVFPSDNPKSPPQQAAITSSTKSSKTSSTKLSFIDVEKLIPESIFEILDKIESKISSSSTHNDHSRANTFTMRDLFYAIHNDNIERVAEIIASGFDFTTSFREFQNGSCLHLVASRGSPTMAYLLLSKAQSRHFLDLLDNELRTAVMCAVAAEKHEILKILMRCGADVSIKGTDGMTALHIASKRGDLASAKIILDNCWQSWNVTKFRSFINSVDDGNWTALVWAAEHGYSDVVSYLISLGADANICDSENNTSLHWAALSDRIDTVLPLLQSNCDFNIQNINGDTPLHISCRQSNTQISLVFLAHGSDLNIKNSLNETPYESIPDEKSQCARAIRFNIQLRELVGFPKRKILMQDISNGRESYPIQIVQNARDNENEESDQIDLPDFKYITKTILLQNTLQIDQRVSQMRICSCSDDCSSNECQCSISSMENWYTSEGALKDDFNYDDPAMIFECNDVCGCNKLLCKNRVVQNGIKCRMQVIECADTVKGWGVHALAKIKKGSYVAEYTGEILTDAEADRRTDDSYFFDLGSIDHCIDANFYGNVSRFFNHSCNPNVVPVRVYFEHQDLRFPKIAFFASRDIDVGEEIAFDYGEKFWVVKFKNFTCHCNAAQCKYSKTTISKTLEDYNQRINPSCVN